MEKAYIILAHKNPVQLLRLITRLDDNQSTFFLHIDKQVDLSVFKTVISYGNNVKLLNREATHWGGMGLVKATLNGLKAVKQVNRFERIILLSGQDYPIKEKNFINDFLRKAESQIFLDYTSIPNTKRWKDSGGLYRVNKYYFGLKGIQRYAAKFMNLSSMLIPVLKRKNKSGLNHYAGSQWWIINSYALDYILNFIENNPEYTRFHRYTFAPDEIYFHTILLNSDDENIRKKITNNNLVYMKWLNDQSPHPELLQKEDIAELISSDNLFARKFDQESSTEILDLIDNLLDNSVQAAK